MTSKEAYKLAVTTNADALNSALARYVAAAPRRAIPDVLREEMKGIARLLTRLTPPRTKIQGEKALRRDLRRAVLPLRPSDFKGDDKWNVEMRKNLRAHAIEAVRTILQRSASRLRSAELVPFSESLHTSARRRGFNVPTWTGKATMDVGAWDEYAAKMLPRVGNARGGWAAAVTHFGGTVAAYIRRHAYAGAFRDSLGNPLLGFIESTNRSTWAKAGLSDRIVANTLRTRAEVILRKVERAEAEARREAFA